MQKRVAVLQSNYIPWKGYFDIIHDVDLFVFYDDVQFTKNDWRNRNRIKTASGPAWLSIPVGQSMDRLVCEVALTDSSWQAKHWRTLKQTYGRSPHFDRYKDYFEDVYLGRQWAALSELNHHLIQHISHEILGMTTRFADSRDFKASGLKQDRLLELLKQNEAGTYVSGPRARAYIDPEAFSEAGIALEWKNYEGYPAYAQRFPPFEHAVTVLDLIFNVGPDAAEFIWGWRQLST